MSLIKKIKDKKVNFEFNKEYLKVLTNKIADNDAQFVTNSFNEMHAADAAGGGNGAAQRLRVRVGAREHGDGLAGFEPGQREHLLPGVDQIDIADGHGRLLD